MFLKINSNDPSFINILKPFFIITIIRTMKIQYIFAYQNKFTDSIFDKQFNNITL